MVKTKIYEQQAKSQPILVMSSKKSGRPDTYSYHCHKLLRASNCSINNSCNNDNNHNNNRNNDNRDAITTIKKQQNLKQNQKQEQDQVQSKMRLLVMNNNVDATQEGPNSTSTTPGREASQPTSFNLSPESTSQAVDHKPNQKNHKESNTSIHRAGSSSRFELLAKKCQLMYGKSNMILSDPKVGRELFSGKVDGKSQRDHDQDDSDINKFHNATSNLNEQFSSISRQEKQSRQRKVRLRGGKRRRRPEVRSCIKLVRTRYNSALIKMWPTWRQLILLSFLSIILTTLLANFNLVSPMSSSSCLLFNHCHALSMQQQQQQVLSSNSLEAPSEPKITHPNKSLHANVIVSSSSSSTTTESPPLFLISSTTPANSQKNINTFVPTLKPRYSQPTPTTPNSSGASINAPTVSPVSTTQSSNAAAAFVPASSQRLSSSSSSSSSLSSLSSPSDKDKKFFTSTPTSLWSSKLQPTEQQLHKQQQQQHQQQYRYQQHAKQQQLTQLNRVVNPDKTSTSAFQRAHVQELTTPASPEGGNNRLKFNFDNNYRNDSNNKKTTTWIGSDTRNNNGNFQAGAKISIKNNSEGNTRTGALSSITRESHVEPQIISASSSKSDLLRASKSDEPAAIVVGRPAHQKQQQQHSLITSKVPTLSSSGAIKLIASPTLHVSELSSTTPSPKQPNSSSPLSSSNSHASIEKAVKPALPHSLQLDDGWSITSDTSDLTTTPNSIMSDTSIRYNPGLPPADLYKVSDSSGRASILASGQGSSAATSQSASPRQSEASGHQPQFLMPAGGLAMPQNLFQSMIHSALSDLMNNEQLFGAASSSSRPIVMRSQLHPALYQPLAASNRRFQLNNNNNNNQPSKQTMAASASAPSISLPPLSHFLVPRNPFRLFSSSSSTNSIATRYRPSFMVNKLTGKTNNKQANGNEQQTNRGSSIGSHYASASNSYSRTPPAFQGSSTIPGLDDFGNTNLYAHSHSAEQLERLIRAASQATGVKSPILPAIVSAPSGAFPGYYIPAIESESESQVSELRHGEPSSSISSKIPGTDYILHPDEVRAMINIGEIAWRQQQQNDQGSNQAAASSKSNLVSFNQQQQQQQQQGQDSSITETRGWQFGNRNPDQAFTGYMQENHAENARDFAYVDPSNRRDQMQAHSSNNNDDHHQQHRHQHQTRQAPINSSELESHLVKHFHQKQLNSFPAIIRVNDQDYIHWPLIRMGQNEQFQQTNKHRNHPHHNFDESRKFSTILHPFQVDTLPFQRPNSQLFALASQIDNHYRPPALLQMPLALNGLKHHFSQHDLPHLVHENHNGWTPSASAVSPSVINGQKGASSIHINGLEQSPVRLATQLTPQEVRQVEDSIIEALLLSQSLQHQRKIMEGLVANQNQLRPAFMIPGQPINDVPLQENNQKQNSVIKNVFFGRRKRRNSSNNNNNSSHKNTISPEKIRQLLLAAAASSPQNIGPIPLVNISAMPIHIVSPILHYTSLPEHTVVGSALVQPEESLVLESRQLASKHRLPVLIADQDTNRPNLLKPISGPETFSADSSAPKATILNPLSNQPLSSDISFAESGRAPMNSEATFGSRVSRIKQHPSVTVTSGTPAPLVEPYIEPEMSKLSALSANMKPKLPPSTLAMSGRKLVGGNEPFLDGTRSKQMLSFPLEQSTSRPFRHVDWPTMVSDADYFPDTNSKASSDPGIVNSQQVQRAELRNVNQRDRQQNFSNNQADNDNLHSSPSHVIRPSQSDKKYVTSQLKLQFAQDYQAREGVPIYNNNVRVAGALDRQRSVLEERPSHKLNTISSQRVPSEIDSSNMDDDTGNDDSDAADSELSGRDLQQKGSSEKKISAPLQSSAGNRESTKPSAGGSSSKLNQNISRYERRPNSRGPQIGLSQLFD